MLGRWNYDQTSGTVQEILGLFVGHKKQGAREVFVHDFPAIYLPMQILIDRYGV